MRHRGTWRSCKKEDLLGAGFELQHRPALLCMQGARRCSPSAAQVGQGLFGGVIAGPEQDHAPCPSSVWTDCDGDGCLPGGVLGGCCHCDHDALAPGSKGGAVRRGCALPAALPLTLAANSPHPVQPGTAPGTAGGRGRGGGGRGLGAAEAAGLGTRSERCERGCSSKGRRHDRGRPRTTGLGGGGAGLGGRGHVPRLEPGCGGRGLVPGRPPGPAGPVSEEQRRRMERRLVNAGVDEVAMAKLAPLSPSFGDAGPVTCWMMPEACPATDLCGPGSVLPHNSPLETATSCHSLQSLAHAAPASCTFACLLSFSRPRSVLAARQMWRARSLQAPPP